ncbi:retrovirus-related pol polyprotein from transposon TNT 1-94 [Tanacetum coccineum]
MGMVDNTLFTKKKSSNLIIVQIYVDDIIFGSTCQDMCDEFAKIMHDEFEMSMMGELNFFLGLQIKQMEDGIFFNQSKYIKEMLKKFGLEDSKPMKTPMSSDTKLTKDEECESVDSTKYRGMIGTTHLGLWYPKGTGIETVVYADSDHAGDYVDRKSTSGICTFVGCCLTSWFSKKQTALAISTTEVEYVSAGKACQQALWMKQALIDYDICPRFILEFYSQYQINYSDEGQMFVEFVIQNQFFSYSLEEFAQILDIPCEGACVFTDKWSLNELAYAVPTDGPYQTNPPSPDDIISFIRNDREGQVTRIRHEEEFDVQYHQILTREIVSTLKPLEEIIQENVFCLGGNRDYVPACLCYMLYCVVNSEKFNLAYYMAKRMKWVTKQKRLILPYGILLTRLFKFIMNENPDLHNESYVLYDRVMNPLTAQQERKTRKDHGMRRASSNLSTMDSTQASSSHGFKKIKLTIIPPKQLFVDLTNDDENLTTPSPTTTSSSPTPLNASSKTPSTNDISLSQDNTPSSFQSKLQISPPSSNEPSSPQPLNPLLDNISDVPPRPSNPQPLQSHPSLDITLSLSPFENLETPSPPSLPQPQPPIMGHLLYYNYLDYHGLTCIAAKFVRDFKSLAKETDESLAKHKALELEIERLMRAGMCLNTHTETNIQEKDKKSSKNRQNRARNGKAWKRQSQIEAKVNPEKSKVKSEDVTEEYLMGSLEPI